MIAQTEKPPNSRRSVTQRGFLWFSVALLPFSLMLGGCPVANNAAGGFLAGFIGGLLSPNSNSTDSQAAQGAPGAPGEKGIPGVSCWDLNGDGIGQPDEDINDDGNFNTLDCKGAVGAAAIACWDLNGNGIGEPTEDKNHDGNFTVEDCQGSIGATGATGPTGAQGPAGATGSSGTAGRTGLACWDSDGDGDGDLESEDLDEDGNLDAQDCTGVQGEQGIQGETGATGPAGPKGDPGLACWDLNGDGFGQLDTEDTNGDGFLDAQDCQGPAGPQGPEGIDGRLHMYGDGSAGARTFDADSGSSTIQFADVNTQYTDVTVSAGTTLLIPSGVTIRCTGRFVNAGQIIVGDAAVGAWRYGRPAAASAGEGLSKRAAGSGDFSITPIIKPVIAGGPGGIAMSSFEALQIRGGDVVAGGGGGAGGDHGSNGGGLIVVLSRGDIINSGLISSNARGGDGGGGGGGVVLLASRSSILNGGAIVANGGDGVNQSSQSNQGAGGGGGGIVHLIAPAIVDHGVLRANGGKSGIALSAIPTNGMFYGGGGGGACGGNGGNGATVDAAGNQSVAAQDGSPGDTLQSFLDPTALFY